MEVTNPANIAYYGEILDLFAEQYAHVAYCVFKINGVVRVVKNSCGVHAVVKVIEILRDDMEGILERNERIRLYMNYSPCSRHRLPLGSQNCARMILEYKDDVRRFITSHFDPEENRILRLRISFANFYHYHDQAARDEIHHLSESVPVETFTADRWNLLKELLQEWYRIGGVEAPESITTEANFYGFYPGREGIDETQRDRLEALESESDSE